MDIEKIKCLKRTELQTICKQYKLKAVGKNVDLILRVKEYFDENKDLVADLQAETAKILPNNENNVASNITEGKASIHANENGRSKVGDENGQDIKSITTKKSNRKPKGTAKKRRKKVIMEDTPKKDVIAEELKGDGEDIPVPNSNQHVVYNLPTIGKDSVCIPEQEENSKVQIPELVISTTVSNSTPNFEASRLIAKISPLMTSTTDRANQKAPISNLGVDNCQVDDLNGSYILERPSDFNTTTDIASSNDRTHQQKYSECQTGNSNSMTMMYTPRTNAYLSDTANASDWLNSCHDVDGQGKRTTAEETFTGDATLEMTSCDRSLVSELQTTTAAIAATNRRETFLVSGSNEPCGRKTQVDQGSRRETFLITTGQPECDPANKTDGPEDKDRTRSLPDENFTRCGAKRKTFLLAGNKFVKNRLHEKNFESSFEENDPDSFARESDNERERTSTPASLVNTNKQVDVARSNYCICHGEIRDCVNWSSLQLIGGLVFVDSESEGELSCRFLLLPSGKAVPTGLKDNMICHECAEENRKISKQREDTTVGVNQHRTTQPIKDQNIVSRTSSQSTFSGEPSRQKASNIPLQVRNSKRKFNSSDKENVSSPFKRRRSEVIIEGAKRGSPGSPQVRRARGERIELSRRLLAPWKPRKHSIDANDRKEDTFYAKKIEEILNSVQPGSEEEMALVMQKKPKLSNM
eukprot:gene12247-13508_t